MGMNLKTKKYFRLALSTAASILLAAAIFIIPISSFADNTVAPASTPTATCGTDSTICNPISGGKVNDIPSLIVLIIKYLVSLIGIVAVLMIIIGGYQMVTSAGNEEGYKKAKQTITYAVIGLVIAVLSYSIASIVENTLGANLAAPATSSVSSSSSTSGTPSPAAGTPATSTTTTGSSTSTNSSTSTGTNGSVGNSTVSQAAPISASSSSCTAAAMGGINISAPSSAVVDPSNGGSIEYAITPDNSSANGCQVTIDTYILEGSDTWNSNLDPNDSSIGFGKANTLTIPESYSQDPYVTIYSMYTDSTGASVNTSANLNLSESSSAGSANNCSAAGVGGINLSVPSSVTVDPSSGGSLEYTLTPDNSSAASCQITINTYVLANGAGAPASGQQPDDTATGFGTNTVNIPAADAYGSEVTLYSVYTDSTGASVNTSESVSITQPSNDNSSDSSNDGSDNSGSYDSGD